MRRRSSRERNAQRTRALRTLARMPRLLIVLRGETFRAGNQHSRTVSLSREPEWRVLRSIKAHILEPAHRHFWLTSVLADVSVPKAEYGNLFRRRIQANLRAFAVRTSPLAKSQLYAVQRSLEWALMVTAQLEWRSLLLTRADLELKTAVRIPPPSLYTCEIIVPFETLDGWQVSDTLIYIPWCRFDELLRVIRGRVTRFHRLLAINDTKSKDEDQLHALCRWVSGVKYLYPERYDANSLKDVNPLYRMVGRAESPITAVPEVLKLKAAVRRPLARGRAQCRPLEVAGSCLVNCANQEQQRRALATERRFNLSVWRQEQGMAMGHGQNSIEYGFSRAPGESRAPPG